MKTNGVTWKMFLLIAITDVIDSIGQIFMKKGLMHIGITTITLGNLQEFLGKTGMSPYVWLGVFFYIVNFCLWITVLSRLDLSIAAPIGSTRYIFLPLLAMIFLGEHVGLVRWMGILLIIIGVYCVCWSAPANEPVLRKEKEKDAEAQIC